MRLPREPLEDLIRLAFQVVRQLLMLLVELLPQLAQAARGLIVELMDLAFERTRGVVELACEVLRGSRTILLFASDAVAERLDLPPEQRLDGRQTLSDFVAEIARLPEDAFLEQRESAIVVAHLAAEEKVAHLVEIGGARVCVRRAGCCARVLRIHSGGHGKYLVIQPRRCRQGRGTQALENVPSPGTGAYHNAQGQIHPRRRNYNAGGMTARETFGTRFGTIMTMIGVAVGLGNVWRFPYMVGSFGGAAFVLFYLLVATVIGVPALMAEYALGRHTRRGTVGAFAAGGLPGGRQVGWFFFVIVVAATAYYSAVIGWVLYYALAQAGHAVGASFDAAAILPPDRGFVARSFGLQLACTAAVLVACGLVLVRGLRAGIERASTIIMPALFAILCVLVVRSVTLPGAGAGVEWFILKFRLADLTPAVMVAAIGQMVFSLSLGGTFMVVYGSYLSEDVNLTHTAAWTAVGDTGSSLLAGFAILPAVFALQMEPAQGPRLIFSTLPQVFEALPVGWLFGLLFFVGLLGAGFLSNVAALEVLVAGLVDNLRLERTRAVWIMVAAAFAGSIPPTINNAVFVPWDLTFGSGMQTLGALLAVLTVGWCLHRGAALEALSRGAAHPVPRWLYVWIRFGIPAGILAVGIWWLLSSVFGTVQPV